MRKIAFFLLVVFVFSVPSEQVWILPLIGTPSRVVGALAIGAGLLAMFVQGQTRKPGAQLWFTTLFVICNLMSLLWTMNVDVTVERAMTYFQLLPIVWLVWEFGRGRDEHDVLLAAFCVGALLALYSQFMNFAAGIQWMGAGPTEARYSATNTDPNELGVTLAVCIPMVWYFFVTRRGSFRVVGLALIPLALIGILMTSSRGASLGALTAMTVVAVVGRGSAMQRSVSFVAVVLLAAIAAIAVVPSAAWTRIFTVGTELQSGTFSGRTLIWDAGVDAFLQHPLLGVGSGAFGVAVESMVGSRASHNVPLAILVEQGLVGFAIFTAMIGIAAWQIVRLPTHVRGVWTVIGLTWLIGAMSLSLQHTKVTWLLLALIAARSAGEEERHIVQARATDRARYGVRHAAAAGTGGFVVRQPGL